MAILIAFLLFLIQIPIKTALLALKATLKTLEVTINKAKSKISSGSEESALKDKLHGAGKAGTKAVKTTGKAVKTTGKAIKTTGKAAKTTAKVGIKATKLAIRGLKLAIRALKFIIMLIRTLVTFLLSLGIIGVVILVVIILILAGAVGFSIIMVMNEDGFESGTSAGGSTVVDGGSGGSSGGDISVSADTAKIVAMSDAEVWQLISEGRFSSYSEANKAAQANKSSEESFWTNLLTTVEVPCWKWGSSGEKVASTTKITINKYLSEYFKNYMTDLYNLPEQYVIVSVGGFSFRTKNNKDNSGNYSGHSFGATLDINPQSDGMGSYSAGSGEKGLPWNTSNGLSDPTKSECCTFDNSWNKLAESYGLEWGGNWSKAYCDPMHFSLVGDSSKDTRGFTPKYEGRTP